MLNAKDIIKCMPPVNRKFGMIFEKKRHVVINLYLMREKNGNVKRKTLAFHFIDKKIRPEISEKKETHNKIRITQ
jgi:hypothetical protein